MGCHDSVYAPLAKPAFCAVTDRRSVRPLHPPTSRSPSQTRGMKPATIRKNCSTSL